MTDDHPLGGLARINVEKNVVMLLWYLANQNSFREFDVSHVPLQNTTLSGQMTVRRLSKQLYSEGHAEFME